ncbi:MAG: hypothetical protein ACE5I3_01360 [Phycisphaerae bacterium]
MKPRWTKWLRLALPGCVLLQITACLGTDPEFFFASTITNALVFNLVSALFNLFVSCLTTATAMLPG